MADIKDSVGDGGANRSHDVSVVQIMLRVVKDAKGAPYFAGNYDGAYGTSTKDAIVRFQQDQKLVPLPQAKTAPAAKEAPAAKAPAAATAPAEKAGLVGANSVTHKKLNELLPATHKEILCFADTNLAYLPGLEATAKDLAKTITAKLDLDAGFRQKLATLVTQMYADHKVSLAIPGSGWRRDFAWQLKLRLAGTGAHPGESNHQYGQAADIGPNGLRWVAGDSTIATADYWLNPTSGTKMPQTKRDQLWKARNQIAYQTVGLFATSKQGDDVHVQGYSDAAIDYPRSLAKLLTTVGKAKWSSVGHTYKTDFGLGGALFAVGSATDNWQGKAAVTAPNLVDAIKAAGKDLTKLPIFKEFHYIKDAVKAVMVKAGATAPAGGGQFLGKLPTGGAKVPVVKNTPAPQIIDGKMMKAADIKAADIAAIQKLLKTDWENADLNWKKWTPIP